MKTAILLFTVIFIHSFQAHARCLCAKDSGDRRTSIAAQPNLLVATVERVDSKSYTVFLKVNKTLSGRKVSSVRLAPPVNPVLNELFTECSTPYTFLKPGEKVLIAASNDHIDESGQVFHLTICDYLIHSKSNAEEYKWAVKGGLERTLATAK